MWFKLLLGLIVTYSYFYLLKEKQLIPTKPFKERPVDINGKKTLRPPNVEVPQPPSMTTLHVYENAAVCSDKCGCSNIGRVIMQQSGNAIDAAIATLLCNGLVTMQSMGVGGGVLMTYYSKEKKEMYSIIGRERAPLKLTEDMVLKDLQHLSDMSQSALAIGVPGEVAAFYEAHTRFGSLPWSYIVQPTLDLCHNGYQITRHQRDALFLNEKRIRADKMLNAMFVDRSTRDFVREGSHIVLPKKLCKTYEMLAQDGPASFYNGSLASLIVEDLHDMGSPISLKDLQEFKVDVVQPLKVDLDTFYLLVPPPPGSGHVLGLVMQILRNFKENFTPQTRDLKALDVHRIVEAFKFGFVKRWEYDTTIDEETLNILISQEYAKNISQLIDDLRTFVSPSYYGANQKLLTVPDYGTAQVSVLAPNGDAVSATSSINYYFGSGRMGTRTGILFNNAISDFNIAHLKNYFDLPAIKHRNILKPQKQPMSSVTPLIVIHKETGEVRLVTGAAGGSRIITTMAQILVRILWMKKNIKQAIDYARFHHQLLPNHFEYEFGLLQQVVDGLEIRGHKTERIRRRNTAACGIEKIRDAVLANADYRKEGGVDGF